MTLDLAEILEVTQALTREPNVATPEKPFLQEWLQLKFPTFFAQWCHSFKNGRVELIANLVPLNRLTNSTPFSVVIRVREDDQGTICKNCHLKHSMEWVMTATPPLECSVSSNHSQCEDICPALLTANASKRLTSRARQKEINHFVQTSAHFEIDMHVGQIMLTSLHEESIPASIPQYIKRLNFFDVRELRTEGRHEYKEKCYGDRRLVHQFNAEPQLFIYAVCSEIFTHLKFGPSKSDHSFKQEALTPRDTFFLPSACNIQNAIDRVRPSFRKQENYSLPWSREPAMFPSAYAELVSIFKNQALFDSVSPFDNVAEALLPFISIKKKGGMKKPPWLDRMQTERCVLLFCITLGYYIQAPLRANITQHQAYTLKDVALNLAQLITDESVTAGLSSTSLSQTSVANFLPLRIDEEPLLPMSKLFKSRIHSSSSWCYFPGGDHDPASIYTRGSCAACLEKYTSTPRCITFALRCGTWSMTHPLFGLRQVFGGYIVAGCTTCDREALIPLENTLGYTLTLNHHVSLVRPLTLLPSARYTCRLLPVAMQILDQSPPRRKTVLRFDQILHVLTGSDSPMTTRLDARPSNDVTKARDQTRCMRSVSIEQVTHLNHASVMTITVRAGSYPFCTTCEQLQLKWNHVGKNIHPVVHCKACKNSPPKNILSAFKLKIDPSTAPTLGPFPFVHLPVYGSVGPANMFETSRGTAGSLSSGMFPMDSLESKVQIDQKAQQSKIEGLFLPTICLGTNQQPVDCEATLRAWSQMEQTSTHRYLRPSVFAELISATEPYIALPTYLAESPSNAPLGTEFSLASQLASVDFGFVVYAHSLLPTAQSASLRLSFPFGPPCGCAPNQATWKMQLRQNSELSYAGYDAHYLTLQQASQVLHSLQRDYCCTTCHTHLWPPRLQLGHNTLSQWRHAAAHGLEQSGDADSILSFALDAPFEVDGVGPFLRVCIQAGFLAGCSKDTLRHIECCPQDEQWALATWIFAVTAQLARHASEFDASNDKKNDIGDKRTLLVSFFAGQIPVLDPGRFKLSRECKRRENRPNLLRNKRKSAKIFHAPEADRSKLLATSQRVPLSSRNGTTLTSRSNLALMPSRGPSGPPLTQTLWNRLVSQRRTSAPSLLATVSDDRFTFAGTVSEMQTFVLDPVRSRIFIQYDEKSEMKWNLYGATFPHTCPFASGSLDRPCSGMPIQRSSSEIDIDLTFTTLCPTNTNPYTYTDVHFQRACLSMWSNWEVAAIDLKQKVKVKTIPFLVVQIVAMAAMFCEQPFHNVTWRFGDEGSATFAPQVEVDMLRVACTCQVDQDRSSWILTLEALGNGTSPREQKIKRHFRQGQSGSRQPTHFVENQNERFLFVTCTHCGCDWVESQYMDTLCSRTTYEAEVRGSPCPRTVWPVFANKQSEIQLRHEVWLYRPFVSAISFHVNCPIWLAFAARLCANQVIWKIGDWLATVQIAADLEPALRLFKDALLDEHEYQRIVSLDRDIISYVSQQLQFVEDNHGVLQQVFQNWQSFLTDATKKATLNDSFLHLQRAKTHSVASFADAMDIRKCVSILELNHDGFPRGQVSG
jgi:hypothetical protein